MRNAGTAKVLFRVAGKFNKARRKNRRRCGVSSIEYRFLVERGGMMSERPNETHGNKTKAKNIKNIVPEFIVSTTVMSDRKDRETRVVDDDNVEYAKKFVEENKK